MLPPEAMVRSCADGGSVLELRRVPVERVDVVRASVEQDGRRTVRCGSEPWAVEGIRREAKPVCRRQELHLAIRDPDSTDLGPTCDVLTGDILHSLAVRQPGRPPEGLAARPEIGPFLTGYVEQDQPT